MEDYTHQAFVPCTECGGAGMVASSISGQSGETVTVVSEGTCPEGHKLAHVTTVTLP